MMEKSTMKTQQESCENHDNEKKSKRKTTKKNRPRLFSRDVTPLIYPNKDSEIICSN